MPITERIVIDADPSIKKMLCEISEEYGRTMKDVVCSLIEREYEEFQLAQQKIESEFSFNFKN